MSRPELGIEPDRQIESLGREPALPGGRRGSSQTQLTPERARRLPDDLLVHPHCLDRSILGRGVLLVVAAQEFGSQRLLAGLVSLQQFLRLPRIASRNLGHRHVQARQPGQRRITRNLFQALDSFCRFAQGQVHQPEAEAGGVELRVGRERLLEILSGRSVAPAGESDLTPAMQRLDHLGVGLQDLVIGFHCFSQLPGLTQQVRFPRPSGNVIRLGSQHRFILPERPFSESEFLVDFTQAEGRIGQPDAGAPHLDADIQLALVIPGFLAMSQQFLVRSRMCRVQLDDAPQLGHILLCHARPLAFLRQLIVLVRIVARGFLLSEEGPAARGPTSDFLDALRLVALLEGQFQH